MANLIKWILLIGLVLVTIQSNVTQNRGFYYGLLIFYFLNFVSVNQVNCEKTTEECTDEMPIDEIDDQVDAISLALRKRTIAEVVLSKFYKRRVNVTDTTATP